MFLSDPGPLGDTSVLQTHISSNSHETISYSISIHILTSDECKRGRERGRKGGTGGLPHSFRQQCLVACLLRAKFFTQILLILYKSSAGVWLKHLFLPAEAAGRQIFDVIYHMRAL